MGKVSVMLKHRDDLQNVPVPVLRLRFPSDWESDSSDSSSHSERLLKRRKCTSNNSSWFVNIFNISQEVKFEYQGPKWLNELGRWIYNSYKPITNMAWVRTCLCKLKKRVHSTRSRK